ncbi:MAG TPA: MFS transporter [Verrucomicrobiae bacterium]|nr:MFS transporter [Verrucomicrobiae bacterium]
MSKLNWKKALPWAFYDWANSAYATTVLSGLYPVFFSDFWSPRGTAPEKVLSWLGTANSTAGVIVACLAPILGAIADRGGARKRFLLFFATLGVVMTASLHLVAQGNWLAALMLYVSATIGFSGANIFYDSLLVTVADEDKFDVVSALGYSLGYLGGGTLFLFNVIMVTHPAKFGFADASAAVRFAFVLTAVWWAVFSLPLFLWVKEPELGEQKLPAAQAIAAGLRQLIQTFRHIYSLKIVFLFLVAYWLYIDGVDTIVLMATSYGKSLGFDSQKLITALLITQFVGFPAAIAFGKMGERIGARRAILIGLVVYIGVTIWGYRMKSANEFFVLAIIIGLVQGGVQSLSRSLYARLIPRDKAGEFFGFYNMLGKFAAVLGPTLMSIVAVATGKPRLSIFAVAALFLAGGTLLYFVREPHPAEA